MEFCNDQRFSFLYGEKSFWELSPKREVKQEGNTVTTIFTLPDGLKVTNIAKEYSHYHATEWVNYFEYNGCEPSQIISGLWDCDCELSCFREEPKRSRPDQLDPEDTMRVLSVKGSDISDEEFALPKTDISYCYRNSIFHHHWDHWTTKTFHNTGGRSSQDTAPFFNIHQKNEGVIMGIGWTGQWNCKIERGEQSVRLQSKIEDTHFRLYPGEKIRTSSVLIMRYRGSIIDSQNQWRRLLREEFSPVGSSEEMPFCAGIWGGMPSEEIISQLDTVQASGFPVEYIWIDAGWYGQESLPTSNSFEGDWASHTGDWRISPHTHPNQMQDVRDKIAEAGKKFLLWFEPERVRSTVPIVAEHPDYFLKKDDSANLLLNLGNEDAYQYCLATLSEIIEKLRIDCYRQDFNFDPLEYWRGADAEDRRGITEIKHICGLYRLWDELLERFPGLLIDNCASGGRRLDVEMLRRSVPLWRSDAQCPANFPPELSQVHQINFSLWMPYSGSGCGSIFEPYLFRSAYASSMSTNFTYSQRETFGDDPKLLEEICKYSREYLSVRHYFDGDLYPLTVPSVEEDAWVASQWALEDSGMIHFQAQKKPVLQRALSASRH